MQAQPATAAGDPTAENAAPGWTFSPLPALEAAIDRVRQLHPPLYPDGLARQRGFLKKLGDPQEKLPFIFHVAGTNGKGSTLAFLQAVFEAAGLSVHKYTSPHLVSFDERIIISGSRIAPENLLSLIDECLAAAQGEDISFFEFFTALAFLAFSRAPADAVLLETGLGGLYDATNAVSGRNLVSLLTRISYDHTHILGMTLPEIAAHKAGIIKPLAPVVIAPQEPEVLEVFTAKIAETKAQPGGGWSVSPLDQGFEYKSARHSFCLPPPRLQGQHQLLNAGLAFSALAQSPFAGLLEQATLEKAMRRVDWPGRLQKITGGALARLLPPGWELWLDGAHNDSGAETLAAQAEGWRDMPLHLVTAMKKTKDASGFYRPLMPHLASVTTLDAGWIDAPMMTAEGLAAQVRLLGGTAVSTAGTLEEALRALASQYAAPQRILVAGSLYLVGHALRS